MPELLHSTSSTLLPLVQYALYEWLQAARAKLR